MKRVLFVLLVATAVLLAACGGEGGEISFSTANIQNPVLAKDEAGADTTTVFEQEDTIYVLADLNNAPDETTVRAVFTAVDAEGQPPNTEIESAELSTGSGELTFNLAPAGVWPNGDYKVDLYLNGELDQTLTYRVAGPTTAQTEESTETAAADETAGDTAVADLGGDKGGDGDALSGNGGALSSVEDARAAVIQIQAEGTFVEPEGVAFNAAGRGSGFIIDPSGIAVTNNHVVAGAALVKVYLDGETEPRNARIIATSECSDLAVIDIDGDGYPYLNWSTGDIRVGNEVYVAGFPLGDPEYTLTRGIVSKENANGQFFPWSSVDHVVEYDAQATGGNSGGPVINNDAQVVAVHYASSTQTDDQAYGIGADIAQGVVDQLRQGTDVDSIGVNGRAVMNEDGSLYGIWVSSVKSGSAADAAGIRPGDLLRQLEGLVLATDGSMADYCDILRSRSAEDTMSFSLWRLNTGEVLEGQLNGRVAEVVDTLGGATAGSSDGGNGGNAGASGAAYSSYVTVNDDSGQLAMNVPAEWGQVDGSAWTNSDGDTLGIAVTASPDINGFLSSWSTPGASFKASSDLGVTDTELIELFDYSGECEYGGREAYSDQLYTGQYDVWTNCGSAGATYVVLTAVPQDNAFVILLEVQLVSDADTEAFQNILSSFIVQ